MQTWYEGWMVRMARRVHVVLRSHFRYAWQDKENQSQWCLYYFLQLVLVPTRTLGYILAHAQMFCYLLIIRIYVICTTFKLWQSFSIKNSTNRIWKHTLKIMFVASLIIRTDQCSSVVCEQKKHTEQSLNRIRCIEQSRYCTIGTHL